MNKRNLPSAYYYLIVLTILFLVGIEQSTFSYDMVTVGAGLLFYTVALVCILFPTVWWVAVGAVAISIFYPATSVFLSLVIVGLFPKFSYYGLLLLLVKVSSMGVTGLVDIGISVLSILIASLIQTNERYQKIILDESLKREEARKKQVVFELMTKRKEESIRLSTTLSERNRIARELHDVIGHSISSSIVGLESFKMTKDMGMLDDVIETLRSGMVDIRTSIHNLHDQSMDLKEEIVKITENNKSLAIRHAVSLGSSMSYLMKKEIVDVVKEAITNVQKHSDASKMSIVIKEKTRFLLIKIRDNGTKEVGNLSYGMGMIHFSAFAQSYGGTFRCYYDGGLQLIFVLPRQEEDIDENNDRR